MWPLKKKNLEIEIMKTFIKVKKSRQRWHIRYQKSGVLRPFNKDGLSKRIFDHVYKSKNLVAKTVGNNRIHDTGQ